jgi:MFS family permease
VPVRRLQLLFAVVGVAEAAILPFLPIVLHERGLSAAEVGAALALASLSGFVATPLWGYAGDRRLGPERTLVVAAVTAAVAVVPLAFAHGFLALAASVVAVTAARSSLMSLADAIVLERLGSDARGDYGRVRLWMSVGWAVAACAWGFALQVASLDLLPGLYAVSALVAAAVAATVAGPRVARVRAARGSRRAMVRRLATFLVSLLVLFTAFSATFSFVAIRMDDLGGGLFVIGVAAALQAVAEVPVMRATPWFARLVGDRVLYVAGTAFFAAAFAAWAFLGDPVSIAAVKLVAGVGFGLAYVGSVVIVDDLVPEALRGTGQGLAKAVSFGLAPIAGSLAGGAVYDLAGPRTLFLACAGAAVVAGGAVSAIAVRDRGRARVAVAAGHEAQL